MKLFYPILFFILLLTTTLNAQDWQWIRDGGSAANTTEYEQVTDMVTDADRNVYVLSPVGDLGLNIDGNTKFFLGDSGGVIHDYALASFSCDGTYRWSKIIGGGGGEYPKFTNRFTKQCVCNGYFFR